MNKEKLPSRKYIRIHDDMFIEWITEIMKDEKMKFANKTDLANEIVKQYGGVATSHLFKMRNLKINLKDYLR